MARRGSGRRRPPRTPRGRRWSGASGPPGRAAPRRPRSGSPRRPAPARPARPRASRARARIVPMLTNGLDGASTIELRRRDGREDLAASGAAPSTPACRTAVTSTAWWRCTKYSWNSSQRPVDQQLRADRVVGHRQQRAPGRPAPPARRAVTSVSRSPASSACVRTRWVARSRSPSPNQVGAPYALQHLLGRPGLVAHAPAGRLVGPARQGVHDRVQVGRDAQAVELQVIAGVDDDRQVQRHAARPPTGQRTRVPDRGSAWRRRSRPRGRRPGAGAVAARVSRHRAEVDRDRPRPEVEGDRGAACGTPASAA